MIKRLLHMLLFIVASVATILILASPMFVFNGKHARAIRGTFALQEIAPQRLFISCWRNIKSLYIDPTMNNQDWSKWKYRYLKHIKTDEDVVLAVNTMLASLNDPHSEFFNKKRYDMQNSYIHANSDKNYSKITQKILKLKPGTTVKLTNIAGIVTSAVVVSNSTFYNNPQKGDILLSINNYHLYGLEMNSAVNLIRGTNHFSKVKIIRNNKIMTIPVVKGAMDISKLDAKLLPDNIVYISIFSLMGQNAPEDFKKCLNMYKNNNGYIIDLRGDVGGLFLNAIYIADELIENGEIVTIEYRNGSKYSLNAEIPSDFKSKPIAILINNRTASSSEILAGALRSNGKAFLVGQPTFGKNVVQQIIPMPNNTGINLTIAKYYFGNGYDFTNGILVPDYMVEINGKDFLSGNDTQLKKAIEIIKKMNKNSSNLTENHNSSILS